jgi:hypothetical protein
MNRKENQHCLTDSFNKSNNLSLTSVSLMNMFCIYLSLLYLNINIIIVTNNEWILKWSDFFNDTTINDDLWGFSESQKGIK